MLQWTRLSSLFTVNLDGYRLRFYPTNVSANLWINPAWRVHSLALFKDYCKEGDVAVDVGANIGEVSIILSGRVGGTGRVYAFEPNPRIYRYLLGNLALNQCANVTALNGAVGATNGVTRLSDDRYDDMNRVLDSGGIEVGCTTLDEAVPGQRIALLKIDVEGSELRVLQGAREALDRTACVNCEMIDKHYRRYGYGTGELIALLRQHGFHTFVMHGSRGLRAIDSTFHEPGAHEIVAIKDPVDFACRTGWTVP